MATSSKIGHGLAKVLGIKLDYRDPTNEKLTRGESTFSVESADSYIEEEPHASEWLRSIVPTGRGMGLYFYNLFPFIHWIGRYNLQWFTGDLIAGITIGAVVVPQSMSYAGLAELPPEYGLYSSFMGVLIYWFFATSKDITIGPVAVMSTLVGDVVNHVWDSGHSHIAPHVIASALAVIAGGIIIAIGLLRLGWLVDFIPLVSISAFMTGSAIFICVGQIPNLMGISVTAEFDTRAESYKVFINTLRCLPQTRIDAALGLTALFMLYSIRSFFNYMARRQPHRAKLWYLINTMRTAFTVLLYTMISALVNLDIPRTEDGSDLSPFAILGPVPRGFQHAAVPKMNSTIIGAFSRFLPATVIVLLIEHIAISKSFGRINNYTIDPSQELVAIGVTNLLAPFLGGYPSTGSFSRTAIKSKAGVRTPLAGVITALVVLLAIYALPAVFFYIPSAGLSAVIIHAVGDLITPPNVVYQFWKISPLEVPIFFAGVIVVIFTTIEIGVYLTVAASLAVLLWRSFKAQGRFLGQVKVHSVIGDQYSNGGGQGTPKFGKESDTSSRDIYLPIGQEDGSNPDIKPQHPYPGVFIYRFSEAFVYTNANHYLDYLSHEIFRLTQRTNPRSYPRPGDRPWNNPGPRKGKEVDDKDTRPTLKAIVLDFSSVNHVDITSIQNLIDVRNQLDRYTAPEKVQWHFANINNRWTKRALASAGFGYATPEDSTEFRRWKPIFSIAEIGGEVSAAADAEEQKNRRLTKDLQDVERGHGVSQREVDSINGSDSNGSNEMQKELTHSKAYNSKVAVVHGLNRPFFHIDLTSAVQSAISNSQHLRVRPASVDEGVPQGLGEKKADH